MAQTASNVSAGKPRVGGAVYWAPASSTLPEDATTALSSTTFKALGYCSQDGLKNENTPSKSEIKAWGGDTVLAPTESRTDNFSFTLIEALNVEVLKAVHGDSNVTGTLSTGITVKSNSTELGSHVWVFDMVMRGGVLKRIVVPDAEVTEISEVTYSDTEAVGYAVKLAAYPYGSGGDTHYEYIETPSTTGSGG